MRTVSLTVVLSFVASACAGLAQSVGAQGTASTHRIASRILGETRVIDIALPRDYARGTERYPVLMVLDGEFEQDVAAAEARFYASTGTVPPMIVVGIRNTDRNRDFTTPATGGFAAPPEVQRSGGADRFIAFLRGELLPYVDSVYRTVPMRVLVGHSLGGLLALRSVATEPVLFTGYVVMEPSTWWNNEKEWRDAEAALRAPAARRLRVMLVNTQPMHLDTTTWAGTVPMVREIAIHGETHESMAAAGMLAALRAMFADFRPAEWRPGTRPIAMLLRYDSLADRVGYTVPIPASAYEKTIVMSIHARQFDDAERMLGRMEQAFGPDAVRDLRQLLTVERARPAPAGLIPLEIPARRPSPAQASPFLGRWVRVDDPEAHEIQVRASGDTIVVHDRIRFPSGQLDEGDHQVIQVTPNGTLEWGLPWFRGIAALLVLEGEIQPDGTMRVTREARGWVPRGPTGDLYPTEVFRRGEGPKGAESQTSRSSERRELP